MPTAAAALMTDRPLKARQKAPLCVRSITDGNRNRFQEQASSNSGNAADHSGHNGHMNASGDDLSRYLTEQDSIMMNMMEDMVIRENPEMLILTF